VIASGSRPVVVAIMAKAPQAGHVKTRLCPPLSADEAAALYRCFLADKIQQVKALAGVSPALAYTPPEARAVFECLARGFLLIAQRGPGLGARLNHVVNDLLAEGYAGVVVIDSDTPTLPTGFLRQAVRLVSDPEVDVVLGPSEDGGYYLIGLRQAWPELFDGIAWSTSTVLADTTARAERLRLRVARLPLWYDVDTPDDLARLRADLVRGEVSASATSRLLRGGLG